MQGVQSVVESQSASIDVKEPNSTKSCQDVSMNLTIETEQEDDGRWIAEVPELSGVMAYGATEREAVANAEALALRVLAERSTPSLHHRP